MHDIDERFPTREEIEQRAYEIYLERGEREGDHLNDWYSAERELTESGRVIETAPGAEPVEAQAAELEKMIEEMYERSRAAAAGAGS